MLGEALRLMRVFHDCKASELAGELAISPSYLSEIERGDKVPSMDVIKKYSDYFDLPVSSIMFFAEDIAKVKSTKGAIRKKLLKFLQVVEHATR